jgi:hypothetical protein
MLFVDFADHVRIQLVSKAGGNSAVRASLA